MEVVVDFLRQNKASARTMLFKARDDALVTLITVIHGKNERLPDMTPLHLVSSEPQANSVLTTYRRG